MSGELLIPIGKCFNGISTTVVKLYISYLPINQGRYDTIQCLY